MKAFFSRPLFQQCEIDDNELNLPNAATVVKIIWCSIKSFFVERPGQIIGSAFILIMLWGTHGNLELLRFVWPDWRGPGTNVSTRPQLIPGVPWDHELISFWVGAFLLVVVPILIIKFVFKEPLSNFGLGLPTEARPGRWRLAMTTFTTLTLGSLVAFYFGTKNDAMKEVYPFFKDFHSTQEFVLYELTYLPFFIAIEFIFRGYLLFGLAGVEDHEVKYAGSGVGGKFFFGRYALLIQMLSYTAWHLGKPLPETWGTLVWGLGAGATAYASNSIWPVVLSHWLLNVFFDAVVTFPL